MSRHPNIHLILGGPGSGKTTRLLEILEGHLNDGIEPEEILFASFTRKAVETAKERARAKFGFPRRRFPYFRTLHSVAFKELGLARKDVFQGSHLKKVAEMVNMDVSSRQTLYSPFQVSDGDKSLFIDGFARLTKQDPRVVWQMLGEYIPWYNYELFVGAMEKYKKAFGLWDFTDMVVEYSKLAGPLPIRIAVIDEAQDLNPVQWDIVFKTCADADIVYIAGDDDQAIYKWSGADIPQFLGLEPKVKEVLPVSWRLCPEVFDFAASLIKQVKNRYDKAWGPAQHSGEFRYTRGLDRLDFGTGSWYLLARNKHLLKPYQEAVRRQGVPYKYIGESPSDSPDLRAIIEYENLRKGQRVTPAAFRNVLDKLGVSQAHAAMEISTQDYGIQDLQIADPPIWHETFQSIPMDEKMYFLAALKNGHKLTTEPQVTIDSIHAVKGGEADNVVLMLDVSKRTYENYLFDPDDEYRVFYVGATRAKKNLHLMFPQTMRYLPYEYL
jgi:superfamily I DNA/RNA helicase